MPEVVKRDVSLQIARLTADPEPGQPFRLRYTLRNETPKPATGVVVAIQLPAGTQVAETPAGFDGGTWTAPAIPADGTRTLDLDVTVANAGAWTTSAEVTPPTRRTTTRRRATAPRRPRAGTRTTRRSWWSRSAPPTTRPFPRRYRTPAHAEPPADACGRRRRRGPAAAPPPLAARAAAANALLLECAKRRLAITGVKLADSKVTVSGFAAPALAGAALRLQVGGKSAGTGKVDASGAFALTVKAPPRRARAKAAYTVVSGGDRSAPVALAQRVLADTVTRSGDMRRCAAGSSDRWPPARRRSSCCCGSAARPRRSRRWSGPGRAVASPPRDRSPPAP